MADVEQRQLHEMEPAMVLETTMSETTPAGFTASPLPKTPLVSRPNSEQPESSPANDLSDDVQTASPTTSRPASGPSPFAENAFEEISLVDHSQSQRSSSSQQPSAIALRPVSALTPAQLMAAEDEEAPISPIDSGSDYSEPSTPKSSRPTSIRPSAVRDDTAIEDSVETPVASRQSKSMEQQSPTKKPSQQWSSLALSNRGSGQSDFKINTSSHTQSDASSQGSSSVPQTPTITVSPELQSPEGSNYSGSPPQSPTSPSTPIVSVSPMTPQEAHMSINSLHSIALSDLDEDYDLSAEQIHDVLNTPRVSEVRHLRKPSSLEILQNTWGSPTRPGPPIRQSTLFDVTKDEPLGSPMEGPEESDDDFDATAVWRTESSSSIAPSKRDSGSSLSDVEVDWLTLDKTEEQEKEDKDLAAGAEDESTTFLLARLEQENAKFSSDPKSAVNKHVARVRGKSRPPSMAQLKRLVSQQDTTSARYSMSQDAQEHLPDEPPPMTELEFWAALVQDYPSTASRLPTLTTTKIRAGIPPPLRGVVWTSMAGARDKSLDESFEKLKDEKSSYEGIINKDVGRSFPGVELFRDAEGEGQKMLGRVLKCFSLHDKDIGYCQGLGFLVGPLLMNMGEKDAFCVLVR